MKSIAMIMTSLQDVNAGTTTKIQNLSFSLADSVVALAKIRLQEYHPQCKSYLSD